MTRVISRENAKLLVVGVACLTVAWAGPAVAHGVHAAFAHDADRVDGKHAVSSGASRTQAQGKLVAHDSQGRLPERFVGAPSIIRTTHPATAWTPNTVGPTSVLPDPDTTTVAGNGGMQIPLSGPQSVYGRSYGLKNVEICYQAVAPGFITQLFVWGQTTAGPEALYSDNIDRSSTTLSCVSVAVGKRAPYGASLYVGLSGGGSVKLRNVRATWSLASATTSPRAAHRPSSGGGAH